MVMAERNRDISVLMVCTEYPPMQGGIGRYTHNLVKSLRSHRGIKINVLSNADGKEGDFSGLSPFEENNSEIIYEVVQKLKPDIVHIQYDHGLYNFKIHPLLPSRTKTGIDRFYSVCKVPIVTTFHTSYKFKQWMQSITINGKDTLHLRYLCEYWKHLINYQSFTRTNSYPLSKSAAGIVLSNYMANLIPGTQVIYHGSEPHHSVEVEQKKARKLLSLPENGRIILVQGFITATKGWNIIKKMNIPDGWTLVLNYSKNHYNTQIIDLNLNNNEKNIINLGREYLSEEELSTLFFASDVVFLPYKAIGGSGTMFDGLGHGKPFLASDNGFFKEFSKLHLGVVAKRNARSFEEGLKIVDRDYDKLKASVSGIQIKLKWDTIAKQHLDVYENVLNVQKDKTNTDLTAAASTRLKAQENT
jgi:glycosyltransferase involved in cell wall biosynthesis